MFGLGKSQRAQELIAQAEGLVEQDKPEEAEPLCREAVTLAPKSADAWALLGAALLRVGRPRESVDEVLEACDRALKLDNSNDRAWYVKGEALNHANRYEEALAALSHIRYDSELALRARRARGLALLQLKRFDALRLETSWLTNHRPTVGDLYLHAEAAYGLKNYTGALSILTQLTEKYPQLLEAWITRAYSEYYLQRYDEAIKSCDHVLATETNSRHAHNAWRMRGLSLAKQRKFEDAIVAFDHVLSLSTAKAANYSASGWARLCAGHYVEALEPLTQALTRQPDDTTALNNLGCLYFYLQYDERALEIHQRICQENDDELAAWISAAEELTALDRSEEALQYLDRAAKLATSEELSEETYEHNAHISAWRGIILAHKGKLSEAQAALDATLAADPDDAVVCKAVAEVAFAHGDAAKASSMIERVVTLEPNNARVWSLKGRILRAAGDEAGAVEAERHGAELLASQRAELAEFEREFPEWANGAQEG